MGIDLQKLIDATFVDEVKGWFAYPGIEGFEVEINYASRSTIQKMVDSCTERVWVKEERRWEEKLSREKVVKAWAEQIVTSWRGLTLRKLKRLIPIKIDSDVDEDSEVDPSLQNRMTLLWNSADFENWCIGVATNAEFFADTLAKREREVRQLGNS